MRDLTEEELKWVSKEQFEYCDCEGIECPICNIYMPEDVAAPLFEARIASAVERSKKAEEANQREKAILAKPESERTREEKSFIQTRELYGKMVESYIRSINNFKPPLNFDQAKEDAEETAIIKFRRPVPYGS